MRPPAPKIVAKSRRAKPARASLLAVYDGQDCVGTVRVGVRGDAVAYGADGKRIGSFSSSATAAAALKRSDAVKP
jgi:hypothetical protein